MTALANVHPGEGLLEEFLVPLGISQNALARAMGVPPRRINEIVLGKRGITADTAVRMALALGTSERFWRSEEHTSELQSLMRTSYAVFCLKKKIYTLPHSNDTLPPESTNNTHTYL